MTVPCYAFVSAQGFFVRALQNDPTLVYFGELPFEGDDLDCYAQVTHQAYLSIFCKRS